MAPKKMSIDCHRRILKEAVKTLEAEYKINTRHTKVLANRILRAEEKGTAVAAASIRRSQHAGGSMVKPDVVAQAALLVLQRRAAPHANATPAVPPQPAEQVAATRPTVLPTANVPAQPLVTTVRDSGDMDSLRMMGAALHLDVYEV
jgi:hypothetical protein